MPDVNGYGKTSNKLVAACLLVVTNIREVLQPNWWHPCLWCWFFAHCFMWTRGQIDLAKAAPNYPATWLTDRHREHQSQQSAFDAAEKLSRVIFAVEPQVWRHHPRKEVLREGLRRHHESGGGLWDTQTDCCDWCRCGGRSFHREVHTNDGRQQWASNHICAEQPHGEGRVYGWAGL